MLESFGLLKPLATLALLESVQLTLELVTLAGDCGIAPGGAAAVTVYLVWAVKGPSVTIALFCGLCVSMLKWFEKTEAPEPITPKKVFERGLERYSPLNGRAAVHTRDHFPGEYASRKLTVKRVRALCVFMLILYAAVCLQGCNFRDPPTMELYDQDGQFLGMGPVKGSNSGLVRVTEDEWHANVLLALAIIGGTTMILYLTKFVMILRTRIFLFRQGEPDVEPAVRPVSEQPPTVNVDEVAGLLDSGASSAVQSMMETEARMRSRMLPPGINLADNAPVRTTADYVVTAQILQGQPVDAQQAYIQPGSALSPRGRQAQLSEPSNARYDPSKGKGKSKPVKGKGKGFTKGKEDNAYWEDPDRGIEHVNMPWEPSHQQCLFGYNGHCRALVRDVGTPRLNTCKRCWVHGSLYCEIHQDDAGGRSHKVDNFTTLQDLNRDFLNAGQEPVDTDRMPFKLGIFLLENEYRKEVHRRLKNCKKIPLKNLCLRLGVDVPGGWRKVEMQQAVLRNIGHPRFAETLTWCLDEDGQSCDNPLLWDHFSALSLQRTLGQTEEWHDEYLSRIRNARPQRPEVDYSDDVGEGEVDSQSTMLHRTRYCRYYERDDVDDYEQFQ